MQFIERSSFAVRSAIYEFRHPESQLRFRLFPMVHVAEQGFYREVADRLSDCSAVILEGVDSRKVGYLSLTYSLLGRLGRHGLVEQDEFDILSGFEGEVIAGDVSGEQFSRSWAALPIKFRFMVFVLVPVVALQELFHRSRSALAISSVESLESRADSLRSDGVQAFDDLIGTEREDHLVAVLRRRFEANRHAPDCVAIVYGAAHMPRVTRFLLDSLGYRVQSAKWVTVMEL